MDKRLYIENYEQLNGIKLNASNIKLNKPLKQVGKNMANQLWGKLCMNIDRAQTIVLNDRTEFSSYLNNPNFKIMDVFAPNDDYIWVNVKNETQSDKNVMLKNTSLLAGIYTTANARIIMYDHLNLLGNAVDKSHIIYTDTDSLVYLQYNNEDYINTGDYLGNFTNELEQYKRDENDDPYIDEFICIASKVYGMLIKRNENDDNPIEIIKVKGHVINGETMNQINFKNLKKLFFGEEILNENDDGFINVQKRQIRVEKHFNIKTKDELKKLQFSFDKRMLLHDYSSVPWGYVAK